MSAKARGLGHIGFYVQDLDLMKDIYANFMVMTLTKVFLDDTFHIPATYQLGDHVGLVLMLPAGEAFSTKAGMVF